MSTRSIIMVTGEHKYNGPQTCRLYKHCDGYPTGNLPVIKDALKRALDMNAEHDKKYKEDKATPVNVDQLVALIIGETASPYGGGARVDAYDSNDTGWYDSAFKPEHLGNQGDLEWIYVIDLQTKSINVYGGGYTGEVPQHAYKKGVVNPMIYAERLKEDFQDGERKETLEVMGQIAELGFEVNRKSVKKGATDAKDK